ncbi:MAG: ATP-binding protein [Deltaproteobacteria bacterium]|nr:ATP-binding protein [Deltaproteobacteria bacterium]
MKIGIAKKLMGSFIIGVVLFALSLGTAYLIMRDLTENIEGIKALSKRVELTGYLQLHLSRMLTPVTNYLITGDAKERDQFDLRITQISTTFEELRRHKGGDRWEEVLRRVSHDTIILGDMALELLYMKNPVGKREVPAMIMEANASLEKVIEEAREFHSITLEDMREMEDVARGKEKKADVAFVMVLAISIMALPLLSLYLSRYLTRPILTLHRGARAIEEGDLSYRISVKTGDEIEALAEGFNRMAASVEEATEELMASKEELQESLHQVTALNDELEAGKEELGRKNEDLTNANLRLKEIDHLKSVFLANMSHELRTPLTAIIGFSELLIDKVMGELSHEQVDAMENILTSAQHLLDLINNILDLSKIEAGKMDLQPETFQPEAVMYLVRKTVSPLAERKKLTLNIETAEGIPEIFADPRKIKQILLNLVGNAIKFTPEGGTITIGAEFKDNCLVLSVTDTGIGIKPEDREKIFLEFQQLDDTASRGAGGTGLGLTLTKRLTELHGGRIELESEAGKGSKFTVYIPLRVEGSIPV